MWAGPLANWIAACDLMLGMDVDVVVPGHGPVTDKAGVAAVRDYLGVRRRRGHGAPRRRRSTRSRRRRRSAALIGAGDRLRHVGRGRAHRRQRRDRVPHARSRPPHPRRRRAVPPHGRARATERRRRRRPDVDVAIVGDGPAGLALAAACRRGRAGRRRGRRRPAVVGDVRHVARRRRRSAGRVLRPHVPAGVVVRATAATRSTGPYGVIDNDACGRTCATGSTSPPGRPSGCSTCRGGAGRHGRRRGRRPARRRCRRVAALIAGRRRRRRPDGIRRGRRRAPPGRVGDRR